jgi:D-glycero-D-manno-heptose 1,7-bisphosphate phosphatase
MIGDRYSDIELARNAGLNSAFVLSGYGRGEWEFQRTTWEHQPDMVFENLFQAVKSIIDLNQKDELGRGSSIQSEASS